MRRLRYFLNSTWVNFKANLLLNALTISGAAVAYFILFLALLFSLNLRQVVSQLGQSGTLTVYAEEKIADKQLKQIQQRLESLKLFDEITYISPVRAREIFVTRYRELASTIDELGYNPLPHSFVAKFNQAKLPAAEQKALSALQGFPGIAAIETGAEDAGKRSYLMRVTRLFGGLLLGSLLLAVLFLIGNTIKLNVFSRREEIYIYKLVGATDGFIRIPFLLEGGLQSLLGAVLALVLLLLFHLTLFAKALAQLTFLIGGTFNFLSGQTMAGLLMAAAILGVLASFVAVGRFLEVK